MTAQNHGLGPMRQGQRPIRSEQTMIGHLKPLHRPAGHQQAEALVGIEAFEQAQLAFAATLKLERLRPANVCLPRPDNRELDQLVAKIELQQRPQLRQICKTRGNGGRKHRARHHSDTVCRRKLRRQRTAEPGQREAE